MNDKLHATAEDFAKWQKQAKGMTIAQLDYAIKDCREAAAAMATHPAPNKEGYYIDQLLTFSQEKLSRK
jgi:hypothetical protein